MSNIRWRKSSYSGDAENACVELGRTWQKSSYSGDGEDNHCVELAHGNDTVLLRESDDPERVIATRPAQLGAFLRRAKAGGFDHLSRTPQ